MGEARSPTPQGIAINPVTSKLYLSGDFGSTNRSKSVYVVDALTNTVETTINLDNGVGAVAINPQTNKLYVVTFTYDLYDTFGKPDSITIINGADNKVISKVTVGDGTMH